MKVTMNFFCSLRIIKERVQQGKFSEKQQKFHQQTIEIKQVKQIATFRYTYSSSQTVEFHPLLQASRDHSTLQP